MSFLSIDPVPGQEGNSSAPVVSNPVKLSDIPDGLRTRATDGTPLGVFYIGEGDTAPPLRVQITDKAGIPIDLTGITATFHLSPRRTCPNGSAGQNGVSSPHTVSGGTSSPGGDATILAPAAGFVEYKWQEGDAVAGSYFGNFVLWDVDGAKMSLPSTTPIAVEIVKA